MYKIKYRSSDEMKDSGVEWLGMVPKEWNVFRSKNIWKKEKRPVKKEYEIVTAFRDGQVTLRENRRKEGYTIAIKEIGYQGVLKGDLVISAMDAFAGAMGISESNGKCSPVYSVCSPIRPLNGKYYSYLLKEMAQRNYILCLAKGIRERSTDFRYSEFATTFLTYPPTLEQQKIANYLDIKTAQFDSIISKKELLIKKLEEAKKSLISEVVTGKVKIVNGKMVPRQPQEMKDSGVEWLGMIPKNWVITKVKYYYDVQLGKMLQPNKKSKRDTLEKYICTINVDWDSLRLDLVKEMWFSNTERAKYLVKNGDLIVNEGGDAGKASIVTNTNNNLYIQNAVHRVRAKKLYTVKYLYYWLFVLKSNKYIDLLCNKATIMHFTNEKFNELLLPLPKGEEDLSLTKYLDDKVSYINDVIKKTTELIQKLKQAKQSLISEAVTGKIDLRDWEIIEEGGIQ